MKGRKLLAGFLSAAMVLGTMAFPVFAANETLPEAVDGVITLTEDVKLGSDFDYNANGGSLTIDLAGYSLKLTGNTILKNGVYTIKNGTVDVENVECTSREGLIRIAPHSDDSATLNMDNVTVKANGYNAQCGLFQFETPGKLNLNKVTINAANVTDGYGVFYSSPGNPSSLTMNEVTMTVTGANKLIYGCNAVITDSNISAQVKKDVFSAVSPVITDSTLTVEAERAVFNDANVYITTATVINSTITPAGTLTSGIVNNTNASSKIILDSVSDIGTIEGVCTASASIGSNLYSSLADALAAAQEGDIVDLLGGTIVLKDTGVTTVPINKNITITNGTFDITDFEAAHSNSIFDIYGGAEVTFEGVDFTGSNYSSSFGVIYAHETSKVTLNNCDFNLDTEKDTAKGGVLKGNEYANDKFVVNNCNFTLKNTSRVFALMTIDMNGGSINATHEPTSREHAFRNVYGTIDDATISFDNFQNGIKDTANASLTFTNSTVTSTNMAEYDLQLDGGATVSGVAFENTNCKAVVSPAITTFANTAAIGTTYYATLEEALAAAQEGEVITLLDDVEPTLPRQSLLTNAEAIDLNNKTLTLNDYDYYWGPMTFANGTINVKTESFPGTAVFWQRDNEALTFSAVEVNAPRLTGCYLIGSDGNDADINIINDSVINVANPLVAVIASNSTSEITIEESTVNADSTGGHAILANNATVNLEKGAELNADGVACGIYFGANGALNVADDAVVNITNVTGDPDWNANAFGIMLGTSAAYNVADTATVNASIYRAPAPDGSNLAKKVKLSFEATDKQEVYNIYAEAVDGTINRLSAVQVKFALDNANMSYTLAPASELGVTLTNDLDDEEAYVFNFNGETAADATGAKLLIGTVTFGGYGNFNFTVDARFNNKIKTAQTTDNIVEEYVPTPDAANEKQGTFDIASSAITGAEVEEAKRDVKVVIDFNNDITAGNDADYNDMTVTLTRSNGEVHTAQVGDLVNGQPNYTAEKAEMTFNVTAGYRYTVVVKGEGYRTARYSTNVDASDDTLVLTFWNNALENADRTERFDYIEEGVERSKKSVTFLAGDIAQDNIIDKYDLAAVVSYFGFDNLKTTNPNYVKYDLNRDGKIDADDISYVLVSWGK